ncbi:C2 domain-containing protein [Candidatus Uabimicrobium sp. HlEnr_7]|uniref:C2 domain-containing protein n=1 Tax=Candidatus Uabimicrobium helgolandensis TaxID=3095367 RepID=UPI0035572E7F
MPYILIFIFSTLLSANNDDPLQWLTHEYENFTYKTQRSWTNTFNDNYHNYFIDEKNYIRFCFTEKKLDNNQFENTIFAKQTYSKISEKNMTINRLLGRTVVYKTASQQYYHVFYGAFKKEQFIIIYTYTNKFNSKLLRASLNTFSIKNFDVPKALQTHQNFGISYNIDSQWQINRISNNSKKEHFRYEISSTSFIEIYLEELSRKVLLKSFIKIAQEKLLSQCVYTRSQQRLLSNGVLFSYVVKRGNTRQIEYIDMFFGVENNCGYTILYLYKKKQTCLLDVLDSFQVKKVNLEDEVHKNKITEPQNNKVQPVKNFEQVFYFVNITSARIFPKKSSGKKWDFAWGQAGKPDVFVVVKQFAHKELFTTPVIKNSLQPVWNYKTPMRVQKGEVLLINVYDEDSRKNDEIGSVLMTVKENYIENKSCEIQFNSVDKLTITFTKD